VFSTLEGFDTLGSAWKYWLLTSVSGRCGIFHCNFSLLEEGDSPRSAQNVHEAVARRQLAQSELFLHCNFSAFEEVDRDRKAAEAP
jgi:hypothetical protein